MKITRLAIFGLAMFMFAPFLAAKDITAKHVLSADSLDVAASIINLAPSIASKLSPPSAGAERTVTNATVNDEGNTRTYYIEGEDVYYTGRVLSTYWLKIVKEITKAGELDTFSYSVHVGNRPTSAEGWPLEEETKGLVAGLLNVVHDLSELKIDHSRVVINRVFQPASELVVFELLGVNNVCDHIDQNTFKLTVTRHFERNRPSYETVLTLPYTPSPEELTPIFIPVR